MIIAINNCYLNNAYFSRLNKNHVKPFIAPLRKDEFIKSSNLVSFTSKSKENNLSLDVVHKINEVKKSHQDIVQHADTNIEDWVVQFDDKDQLLALKLLEDFKYFSLKQARNCFKKLHQTLLEKDGFDVDKTCFTYFGEAKSGGLMAYLYAQAAGFREKGKPIDDKVKTRFQSFSKLEETGAFNKFLSSGKDTIVIVDDLIDNGNSFKEFLSSDSISVMNKYKKIYYVTLLKNPNVVEKFKGVFRNIEFISYDDIEKYDSSFSKKYSGEEKEKIKRFLDNYSEKIDSKSVKKFENSRIFVTFEWNTPGNTPMPFCFNKQGVWKALFNRYNGVII